MKKLESYYNRKGKKNQSATLTDYEKRVVKTLLEKGLNRQDITYLLNIGRDVTLNLARTYDVEEKVISLSEEELKFFELKQQAWDFKTGLNPYNSEIDKLIINAKEAMIQAVSIFNSPDNNFALENYLILANVSWLYLFQALCKKHSINYINIDGTTQALSYMISQNTDFLQKVNIEKATISNIEFIIDIRDFISHNGLYSIPAEVLMKLQSNCINFNNILKKNFGIQNGFENIFSIALQFASISLEQSKILASNKLDKNILSFISAYEKNLPNDILENEQYQFTITYIMMNEKNKNKADAVRFITPETENYNEIKDIVIKEISDEAKYKYMMKEVVEKTGKTQHQILQLINKEKLRDIKTKTSNNKKMIKCYEFGKVTQWKYTEDFINLCKDQIK